MLVLPSFAHILRIILLPPLYVFLNLNIAVLLKYTLPWQWRHCQSWYNYLITTTFLFKVKQLTWEEDIWQKCLFFGVVSHVYILTSIFYNFPNFIFVFFAKRCGNHEDNCHQEQERFQAHSAAVDIGFPVYGFFMWNQIGYCPMSQIHFSFVQEYGGEKIL